jgi:chromate transporter
VIVERDGSELLGRPSSPRELFVAFTLLALQGFGGVIVVAQRVLCEDKRWLTRAEFVELLSVGQVVPGPNVCNVALMMGDRFFGWRGAAAALGGLLTVPFAIVLALVAVYARWAAVPAVAVTLGAVAFVLVGLLRVPLAWALLAVGPAGCGLAWRRIGGAPR